MDDVPQDVAGSLLSERQVSVLRRRTAGESYETIADALETTPEGVRTLEENARRQIDAAYRTVRIAESLPADGRVEVDAGTRLLDVVRLLRSAGDRMGVKLGTTEGTLHETLEDLLARMGAVLPRRLGARQAPGFRPSSSSSLPSACRA